MVLRKRRFLNVIAAVEAARGAHPELATPLNWPRLQRILARESISILIRPIHSRAYVQGADGSYVVVVNSALNGRHHTRVIAHEYGHIRLHLAGAEIERQLAPCTRGDPREYEAELFALLLRLGPSATPDHPEVAKLVAKLEAPAHIARLPEQTALELPEKLPEFKPLPEPFQHEREYERGLRTRGAAQLRPKSAWIFRDPPKPADFDRIKWFDETKKTTRFEDAAGRMWWIYNFRKTPKGWERISDFMKPEITHRLFVNGAGVRRLYQFANRREHRHYRVGLLDRQLAHSRPVARRSDAIRALLSRTRRRSS